MTNKTPNAAETAQRLKMIVDYVRDCQARVTKGELMELQGLDKNVIELCDAIARLPKSEGEELEEQMVSLIDSLEVLAHTMKEQQDRVDAAGGK